jgi:hypothetical protein
MHRSFFRVQCTQTGKFWNGNTHFPTFNAVGAKWAKRSTLEQDLAAYLLRLRRENINATMPATWRVVEVEYVERVKHANPVDAFMTTILIKSELQKLGWRFVSFYTEMCHRGVADQIEYILHLRPEDGQRFVSWQRIKEARAQLRLLGVKTRTFREHCGMFGMLDRDQAMKARLTLDVQSMVDLSDIRRRVNECNKLDALMQERPRELAF